MLSSADEAVSIKSNFINPAGQEPSETEMRDDYDAAHSLVRTEGNLFDFATITQLRLPWDNVTTMLRTFMAAKVSSMRRGFSAFANFENFRPTLRRPAEVSRMAVGDTPLSPP